MPPLSNHNPDPLVADFQDAIHEDAVRSNSFTHAAVLYALFALNERDPEDIETYLAALRPWFFEDSRTIVDNTTERIIEELWAIEYEREESIKKANSTYQKAYSSIESKAKVLRLIKATRAAEAIKRSVTVTTHPHA